MINRQLVRLWAATNLQIDRRNERGANLVEYALLVGLIAIVCVAAVGLLGSATEDPYSELGSGLRN